MIVLVIYRILLWCLYWPYRLVVMPKRLRAKKEDPSRYQEKFGCPARSRPDHTKPLLWMHGASVGESVSLLPLIERLTNRFHILLTTGTVTSAAVMEKRLPPGVIHQYAPLDFPPCVDRFLRYWQPDYIIWVESELWPHMITTAYQKEIPLALVNMRLSENSLRFWQKLPSLFKKIMGCFKTILTQTQSLMQGLHHMGVGHVAYVGNLKYVRNTPVIPDDQSRQTRALFQRPHLWMAASTHHGEEEIVMKAHQGLQATHPATLILAPRHPERCGDVIDVCNANDLSYRLYSQWMPESSIDTDVFIIDTIGVLPLFYEVSDLVFVGGSLRDGIGGHSILEPLFHGKPTLHGPYMSNFIEVVQDVHKAKAGECVAATDDLLGTLTLFYDDEWYRTSFQDHARGFSATVTTIVDEVVGHLNKHLWNEEAANDTT